MWVLGSNSGQLAGWQTYLPENTFVLCDISPAETDLGDQTSKGGTICEFRGSINKDNEVSSWGSRSAHSL